jgi:transcriptional regulator with PAS, ATPase and Fis domain
MKNIFVSWIGFNDLDSISGKTESIGPLRAFLGSEFSSSMNEIHLIYNAARKDEISRFIKFIGKNYSSEIISHDAGDIDPSDFRSIYKVVKEILDSIIGNNFKDRISWHFHTSPGTPQMASIWLLLGASEYPAELYQSYRNEVKKVDVPFNIDAEYIERLRTKADRLLNTVWGDVSGDSLISHKSAVMKDTVETALKIAARDVPAFILGETGTGKEEFAKLIHRNSKRSDGLFYAVNCAAIPDDLVESTLFGHEKGSFTGANSTKVGIFEACSGGTVFLDEIGDLSLNAQAKILRVLQEFEIQKVGSVNAVKVDVRIISATHKNPLKLIREGKFREDLFHRINIGMFEIPPLRERSEDIMKLAEYFLDETNTTFSKDSKIYPYKHKKFSVKTKNFIKNHGWPGNVRELKNSILRACMMIEDAVIEVEKFKDLLLINDYNDKGDLVGRDISLPVQLDELVEEIKQSYIEKALAVSGGNKTKAARLLGWQSYQKLDHYLKKTNR